MITITLHNNEFSSKEELIDALRVIAREIEKGATHGINSWEIKGDTDEVKRKLTIKQ